MALETDGNLGEQISGHPRPERSALGWERDRKLVKGSGHQTATALCLLPPPGLQAPGGKEPEVMPGPVLLAGERKGLGCPQNVARGPLVSSHPGLLSGGLVIPLWLASCKHSWGKVPALLKPTVMAAGPRGFLSIFLRLLSLLYPESACSKGLLLEPHCPGPWAMQSERGRGGSLCPGPQGH